MSNEIKGNIKLAGMHGTWYVIEETVYNHTAYELLESEEDGNDVAWVIVEADSRKVIISQSYEGFIDLWDEMPSC